MPTNSLQYWRPQCWWSGMKIATCSSEYLATWIWSKPRQPAKFLVDFLISIYYFIYYHSCGERERERVQCTQKEISCWPFLICRCLSQWGLMFVPDLEKLGPTPMRTAIKEVHQNREMGRIILEMHLQVLQRS